MNADSGRIREAEEPAAGGDRGLARFLVPPAMLVVAVAIAYASHLHIGLQPEVAMAVGVSLFCLMLMSHVLLRFADAADLAAEEAADRQVEQIASPMPHVSVAAEHWAEQQTAAELEALHVGPAALAEPGDPAAMSLPPMAQTADVAAAAGAPPPAWTFRPVDLMQPDAGHVGQEPAHMPAEMSTLGGVRPTFEGHAMGAAPAPHDERLSVDREADRIDAILKKLARQIHEGGNTGGRGVDLQLPLPSMTGGAMPPDPVQSNVSAPALEELAAASPETALASAVDALRSTVEAMKGAPASDEPALSPAEISVAAVADAIQGENADVFLSPILGLADQSARHFEVSVKLRTAVEDERAVAKGAGLLPLLDALTVRHAAGFVTTLQRRGRDGAVFSAVDGKSLQSDQFVNDVAGRHAQGVADRMVLFFAQDEMRGLGPAQFTALEDLARLGFRFALQGVADLDMDFEALRALGFEFVKLDATVFQQGLLCAGEVVPASEIGQHLQDLGLSVIVGGIADTETRDRMIGWGVVYGQGALFGAPRPVPVTPSTHTMAA